MEIHGDPWSLGQEDVVLNEAFAADPRAPKIMEDLR